MLLAGRIFCHVSNKNDKKRNENEGCVPTGETEIRRQTKIRKQTKTLASVMFSYFSQCYCVELNGFRNSDCLKYENISNLELVPFS